MNGIDKRNGLTRNDWALLAARVLVGLMIVAHGAQKMFGAFGGAGLAGTVAFLGPVGYLVAVGELFGGLGIALGVLPRFSAAANLVIMLGAIQMVHGKFGFFMNWTGQKAGEGFEFHLVTIAALLVIAVVGPGALVVTRLLPTRRPEARQLRTA